MTAADAARSLQLSWARPGLISVVLLPYRVRHVGEIPQSQCGIGAARSQDVPVGAERHTAEVSEGNSGNKPARPTDNRAHTMISGARGSWAGVDVGRPKAGFVAAVGS